MTADLKPYPSYKPSSVEWLGEVPTHWEVRRLKWVASLNPSRTEARPFLTADTPVTFLPMERVGTDGEIDEKMVSASDVWNGFTYFRRDDVLVAKITPCFENGKGACLRALSTEIGFGSTEFHVLRAGSSISPQFLYRLTTLAPFRRSGAEAMTGAAGQQRVPQAFVANYPLPVPPLAEQAAIVRYLDHTDGRIRRYLRSRERLIELLKEYRQAVIHEAVTRGLDPDMPLKPSGVEWLGDMPAHWEVRRLKNICRLAYGDSLSSEARVAGNILVYGSNGQVGVHSNANTNGQCLIIGRKGSFGKVHYSAEPVFAIDTTFFVDRRHTGANIRWLYYLLGWLKLDAISKDSAVPGLNREDAYQHIGFYPPLAEQATIAAYLDKETSAIDAAMTRAQREIDLLSEYRTRLIADVVTGQVDVREATG